MTQRVLRTEIRSVLQEWLAGRLAASAVHAWAEERYASSSFEAEDDIANEVLGSLDMLDMNLTTEDDVPTFLKTLEIPASESERASRLLDEYANGISMEERRQTLGANPFYAPFIR